MKVACASIIKVTVEARVGGQREREKENKKLADK